MTLVPLDRSRLEAALEALAERDREVEAALARLGPPEPRVREPGFATLLPIVVAQQLSTKAAAAIWARLERAMGGACRPEAFLALGEAELRAAGLSTRKIAYGRGLAEAVLDGRLPIDNNATERDLRALTIGRRNWLFIGSREAGPRAAILYTVVASAARHNLDVWAYLRDVLERLAEGEPDLESLLPDVWAACHPEAVRSYRAHEREAVATAKRARRERRRALERIKAKRR